MRRRALLAGLGGLVASTAPVAAHPGTPGTPSPDSSAPAPLGSVSIEQPREAVVSPDGATVYVAATDGFAVVDVADPAAPAVVTERAVLADDPDGPLGGIWDLAVDGDRLLVVGPAHGSEGVEAAVVFDVSDPSTPRRTTVHRTDYPIHNADLGDGVAYLTANGATGNPLVTVDAATGSELGRWSLFDRDRAWRDVPGALRALHDVRVRDDRAYLAHWDAGTWILDVSDPGAPSVVSRVRGRDPAALADTEDVARAATTLPGNDHFVAVDEERALLGVGLEAWAASERGDGGPGGIHLYDVSDPTAPRELSRLAPPATSDPTRDGVWTTAHNFHLVEDRCYAAWYQGGVSVHDLSDPTAPRELFAWRDGDRTAFWTAQLARADECFVASSWKAPGEEEGTGGVYAFPDPASATAQTDGIVGASGEGFGLVGAAAGLGLGALWARLRG